MAVLGAKGAQVGLTATDAHNWHRRAALAEAYGEDKHTIELL